MVTQIAEHSVDLSRLSKDSKVLDLGCREFSFTKEILKYVKNVIAVDADSTVKSHDSRVKVYNVAVSSIKEESVAFIKHGNGTGNYIHQRHFNYPEHYSVEYPPVFNIQSFSKYVDVDNWALIKMDVEGAEYGLLAELSYPIAEQISVEFHQHTQARRTQDELAILFHKLSKWYSIHNFVQSNQHGSGDNYWDVLLIRKEDL